MEPMTQLVSRSRAFVAFHRTIDLGVADPLQARLVDDALRARVVDHDTIGAGDEQVAGLAEFHVGKLAQDVPFLQVDGTRDHVLHLARGIEHRLGQGDLCQAGEPVQIGFRDDAGLGGDRLLEVGPVLDVHFAGLLRAAEARDQVAVGRKECDVAEGLAKRWVPFDKGLQRRRIREFVCPHAGGEGFEQGAPADELLVYRVRNGRQARERFVFDRGLHARLDQLQCHSGNGEGGRQHHRGHAEAETCVQADVEIPET
jgi:hypothetical protein